MPCTGGVGGGYHEFCALLRLGDAYRAARDRAAARDSWQRALGVLGDQRHPEAGRVRSRLRHLDAHNFDAHDLDAADLDAADGLRDA